MNLIFILFTKSIIKLSIDYFIIFIHHRTTVCYLIVLCIIACILFAMVVDPSVGTFTKLLIIIIIQLSFHIIAYSNNISLLVLL